MNVILHLGLGSFHRAHQAWYTDRAIEADGGDWLICGVSLRWAGVADQLNPQDGLYTVTERSAGGSALRVVGAVHDVLVGTRDGTAIAARLLGDAEVGLRAFEQFEGEARRVGLALRPLEFARLPGRPDVVARPGLAVREAVQQPLHARRHVQAELQGAAQIAESQERIDHVPLALVPAELGAQGQRRKCREGIGKRPRNFHARDSWDYFIPPQPPLSGLSHRR